MMEQEKKMASAAEKSENREVSSDDLEVVNGGMLDPHPNTTFASVYRHNYETGDNQPDKMDAATNYCRAFEMERIKKPKYPCPVCGSWKVVNYDPGLFYKMRVLCFECTAFRDRNNEDPWM